MSTAKEKAELTVAMLAQRKKAKKLKADIDIYEYRTGQMEKNMRRNRNYKHKSIGRL